MKFLIDHQLPPALVQFFRVRGCESEHVFEIGMASSTDAEICEHAIAHDRIIVTKDEDFLYLSRRANSNARVLWVRLGNCRTPHLFSALDQQWTKIKTCFESGDRIVEIR